MITLNQKMVTIVNEDLYINSYNLRYVGEKTACRLV